VCEPLHTSNHHYFDGDNKGPLSDGRHRLVALATQSRGIPPLFKADTVNIAVSASKDREIAWFRPDGTMLRSSSERLRRILPGARSQIGRPQRYL
jgi:hypothetical protein